MSRSPLAARAFVFLALFALLVFSPVNAATTYAMTLQTDAPSYTGSQQITVKGVISPLPGPNTGVIIIIRNSVGSIADVNEVFPSPSDGSFTGVFVPGANPAWIAGTFTVNATWGGTGGTASKVVAFVYTPAVTTSTTTTTSTTSTSSSSTSSTSTTSTVPEFPPGVVALIVLLVLGLLAAMWRRVGPPSLGARAEGHGPLATR